MSDVTIAQPIGVLCDLARGDGRKANILRDVGDTLYREGIHATEVNRLSEAAGVSKRTLYLHFPSKDVLVTATRRTLRGPRSDARPSIVCVRDWC